jgi:hypothetical protein
MAAKMDNYMKSFKKTVNKARAATVEALRDHLIESEQYKELVLTEDQTDKIKQIFDEFRDSITAKKKREPTAFNLFTKDNMERLKQENPGLPHKELMKLVSLAWKEQQPNKKVAKQDDESSDSEPEVKPKKTKKSKKSDDEQPAAAAVKSKKSKKSDAESDAELPPSPKPSKAKASKKSDTEPEVKEKKPKKSAKKPVSDSDDE